jgi:hypothetical protein
LIVDDKDSGDEVCNHAVLWNVRLLLYFEACGGSGNPAADRLLISADYSVVKAQSATANSATLSEASA